MHMWAMYIQEYFKNEFWSFSTSFLAIIILATFYLILIFDPRREWYVNLRSVLIFDIYMISHKYISCKFIWREQSPCSKPFVIKTQENPRRSSFKNIVYYIYIRDLLFNIFWYLIRWVADTQFYKEFLCKRKKWYHIYTLDS